MGLLTGFVTILLVIAAGAALAHVGVLDRRSGSARRWVEPATTPRSSWPPCSSWP